MLRSGGGYILLGSVLGTPRAEHDIGCDEVHISEARSSDSDNNDSMNDSVLTTVRTIQSVSVGLAMLTASQALQIWS